MPSGAKLTLTTFLTLDGVMQGPGGPDEDRTGGFEQGGWLVPYFNDEGGKLVDRNFRNAEAFLLGRKTYDIFSSYWPKVTDPDNLVATALNRLPKYVATKTLKKVDWNNSSILSGDLVAQIQQLKQKHKGEIQVHGSGDLARTLIANDLVDDFHLWLFPILLGKGKKLFDSGVVPTALKLVKSQAVKTGVVLNTYQRAGKPTYGSF